MNPPDRGGRGENIGWQAELLGVGAAGAQSFLGQLLQHTPAPIYVASLEGRYLFVNRAWEELSGIPLRQALGRLTGEMFSPETARRLKATNRQVIESGDPLHVEELVDAPGGAHTYHTVKFPVRDAAGTIVAVGGISIDITERKKAETALRDSEARLQRFFEATFEGLVLHENGVIRDANQAAADLYRCSVAYMKGRSVLEFAAPASVDAVRERIAQGDERPYEAIGLRVDGTTFPGELRARNCASEGRTVRATALRDLTERKQAEQRLEEYARRLQTLSRRLLEVQEEERARLSQDLHDEVGQLLFGLRLVLERGALQGGEALVKAVGEARELIQELAGQVRDFALRLRPSMLDDLGLAPALLWHLERYTAQTGVRVDFHHAGLSRRLSAAGETAAYRIVQEALTNTARHAGVKEATLRIDLDGGALRLQIDDQGAGFDAEAVLRSGACCGLSGMRQRAARLGGRLDIASAPGRGTRLRAEWPDQPREEDTDGPDSGGG